MSTDENSVSITFEQPRDTTFWNNNKYLKFPSQMTLLSFPTVEPTIEPTIEPSVEPATFNLFTNNKSNGRTFYQ